MIYLTLYTTYDKTFYPYYGFWTCLVLPISSSVVFSFSSSASIKSTIR